MDKIIWTTAKNGVVPDTQAMYNPIQKTILVPSPQCGFCFQAVFKF